MTHNSKPEPPCLQVEVARELGLSKESAEGRKQQPAKPKGENMLKECVPWLDCIQVGNLTAFLVVLPTPYGTVVISHLADDG